MSLVHSTDPWALALGLLLVLLASSEAGYRVGLREGARAGADAKSEIGTIQAGMLGLVGLLLGFTFSMAVTRFDARRQLVLEEANALGTTALRAELLPEPARGELRALLRDYLDTRLAYFAEAEDSAESANADSVAATLRARLWSVARSVSDADPHALPASLFVQALNETFDAASAQAEWLGNRVPAVVLFLNLLFATVALMSVGYGSGLGGRRTVFATVGLSILTCALIVVILDLDEPRAGMIELSPRALVELRTSLAR